MSIECRHEQAPSQTRLRRAAAVLVVVLLVGGCGRDGGPGAAAWGEEAIVFFEELSARLSNDDVYGVLDFYSPGAVIENRTSDFQRKAVPVDVYLAAFRADLARTVLSVYLGASSGVSFVRWEVSGRLGAIASDVDDAGISSEIEFTDLDSLQRSLLASPDVAERYEALYRDFLEAWSTGSPTALSAIYAPDAEVLDALTGVTQEGIAAIVAAAAEAQFGPAVLGDLDPNEPDGAGTLALFLDPSSFGRDPQRAVAVFSRTADDCTVGTAVVWQLAEGRIQSEARYSEVASVRRCLDGRAPSGWWTGRSLPPSRDQLVTSTLSTSAGQVIAVHNGSEALDAFIGWGISRYVDAGLDEPRIRSVTFEPTRQCEGVGGRIATRDSIADPADLVLCIYQRELCDSDPECAHPRLATRVALLHELGHAWLHDNVDEATRRRLLEVAGREVWADESVPWSARGVEYAAEVMAWGLMDEPVGLEQLGNPPCAELDTAFAVLTDLSPGRFGACADRTG